ncbi:hypothetical protein [Nocardia farcinica]|uniref:hypothetical protein n=1 Tax=Nocardia farcinica TaxID=37329 RepID=UPI0028064605|nr:hypothetical protein [Nocardia farcinica]
MADQYLLTVLTLTVTTTVLVIWVVEPSAMRLLGRWLHGPQLRVRDAVGRAPALWRIRVRLDDRPGRLEALTARLALGIAARVAADPDELPLALAELLGARYLAPGADHGPPVAAEARLEVVDADATLCFVRPDEPFTPAETARAHRLCDLAGAVVRRGESVVRGVGQRSLGGA